MTPDWDAITGPHAAVVCLVVAVWWFAKQLKEEREARNEITNKYQDLMKELVERSYEQNSAD